MDLSGGCLCGDIRYRYTGEIDHTGHCHCSMCRKANGAAAATWVTVARDGFAVTQGEPAVYRSSAHAERRFCPRCGSPLTYWSERDPGWIDVTLGTLDRPEEVRPDRHVWTPERLPWLTLDPDLKEYPGNSPPED